MVLSLSDCEKVVNKLNRARKSSEEKPENNLAMLGDVFRRVRSQTLAKHRESNRSSEVALSTSLIQATSLALWPLLEYHHGQHRNLRKPICAALEGTTITLEETTGYRVRV